MWCIPELNDEYIRCMEDVLALYEKPYKPAEPVVCLDERPTPLRADERPTRRNKDGSAYRDSEYSRHGVANVFGVVEPKAGRHFTRATKNRKKPAFARMIRTIERAYPQAKTIHLVMDNLSSHTATPLKEVFGEKEGSRIWSRFTVHYTPKHGSWLNQAECELSIYVRQCLGRRRLETLSELREQTTAWNRRANRSKITIDWKFGVCEARRKFKYKRLKTSRSRH
jgi:transposase